MKYKNPTPVKAKSPGQHPAGVGHIGNAEDR